MSDGVAIDEAIAWAPLSGNWSPRDPPSCAEIGEWRALVWKGDSCMRPWRSKVGRDGSDYLRIRSYRTEEAALLATGERLKKAAS